jgi:tRNA G18 (ribose-2'-O)-methylase SpoU
MTNFVRTHADDPRIAAYRGIRDPELLRSRGLFVAEGRLVVSRVLSDTKFSVRSLLLNDAAYRELAPLIDRAPAGMEVLLCETSAFLGIAGINVHRGCLALVKRPEARNVDDLIAGAQRIVALDAVGNPDNVGSIFRNAAAFGVDGVIVGPGCCDPLYRKSIRTSMGAVLRVPFAYGGEWTATMDAMRREGLTCIALTPRRPSEPIDELAAHAKDQRFALIVGSEGDGLMTAIESSADARVRIPIADAVDSLNVGVAVGIALYALDRDRGLGD